MSILNLFGGEDRIKNLKIRIVDLEVEMNAVKQNIANLFLSLNEAKKRKYIIKEDELKNDNKSLEGAILPESESFYKRK